MKINAEYLNETHMKLDAPETILREIGQYFRFQVPDYEKQKRFNPKMRFWDGYVRLFNLQSKKFYMGLAPRLIEFCKDRKYEIIFDSKIAECLRTEITYEECVEFVNGLRNKNIERREYQDKAIYHAIKHKRAAIIAPTGSGKSFIIYAVLRWLLNDIQGKAIIIVPSTGLVDQMYHDFKSYGCLEPIHLIMAGKPKNSIERVYISTWQSIYNLDSEYFEQFDAVFVDELHLLGVDEKKFPVIDKKTGKKVDKKRSIINVVEMCKNAYWRIGCTGTLQGTDIHASQAVALFGEIIRASTTKNLIDTGYLSNIIIQTYIMKYPENISKQIDKLEYEKNVEFIENLKNPRNLYILDLSINLTGNVLIVFAHINHGLFFRDMLTANSNKNILYIDGLIDAEKRTEIRGIMEKRNDCVLVGSSQTISTGMNIKNLQHVVFASTTKSEIRTLQTIGRALRLHDEKDVATIHDICDNVKYPMRHYESRLEFYVRERFPYEEHRIDIMDWYGKNKSKFTFVEVEQRLKPEKNEGDDNENS